MLKRVFVLILIFIGVSCVDRKGAESIPSKLELERDLFSFSSKIEENDTIQLKVNLSLCMVSHYEEIIIVNRDQKNFISGTAQQTFLETEYQTLAERELKKLPDSLSFESFFRYLDLNDKVNYSNPFMTIIHNNDSIRYLSSGVGETDAKIQYYIKVMRQIYPEISFYKEIEVIAPPKPKPAPKNK